MPNTSYHAPYSVRLDTLITLRWLMIGGQAIVLLTVYLGLGFALHLRACLLLVSIGAISNIVLQKHYPQQHRLHQNGAATLFASDILIFTLLLHQTGGLSNPFAIMYVGPAIISAAVLSPSRTALLGTLTVACSTLLLFDSEPLPWVPGEEYRTPILHLAGIWTAILLTLLFSSMFTLKVAEEARKLSSALLSTERIIEREQHLFRLDGLAAAAAHELGTPLTTIALVAHEMASAPSADLDARSDLKLILDEVDRCRKILTKLTERDERSDEFLDHLSLDVFIDQVVSDNHRSSREISFTKSGEGPEPLAVRTPAIIHALTNILDNAAEFARTQVAIHAIWNPTHIALEIKDDGPGFQPDVIDRIGDPYVSTRRTKDRGEHSREGGGLGLGMFIAKTLLERSGALITFQNAPLPATGAVTRIVWPRHALTADT
ncbi:ATPase [Camelimonas fluminis]|uniref:histidine kinase n=1 Tax=Camelimonas fluminis TaxID=1576911 RepID=A0ABV7UBM3_9HYPH|nr:ActS/PrrB/RegB family redox-sensitive histidine kinase [Camelimonas fluminis]GHE79150.1 ATPase [Camelimonas fluminis]